MRKTDKTVLILAYQFAPQNVGGTYRPLKFVKYLPDFGYKPVVLTIVPYENDKYLKFNLNEELLNDIPEEAEVVRIPIDKSKVNWDNSNRVAEFIRFLLKISDDNAKMWRDNLLEALPEIIAKHKPEVFYATLPPFSMGELATEISKKYALPLVIDMRDLFSHWAMSPHKSKFHFKKKVQLESKWFKQASAITTATPELTQTFRDSHPNIKPEKFKTLLNGIDSLNMNASEIKVEAGQKMNVAYIGSFYYSEGARRDIFTPWYKKSIHKWFEYVPRREDWLYRTPYFFLKAMRAALDLRPELDKVLTFTIYGTQEPWLEKHIDEMNLREHVTIKGFVPKSKIIQEIDSIDYFLATSEKVEGRASYCIPSKIFDYFEFNKPILAFIVEGDQKDVMQNYGSSIFINPEDAESKNAQALIDLHEKGVLLKPNSAYLKNFQRKNLTEQLSQILDSIQ